MHTRLLAVFALCAGLVWASSFHKTTVASLPPPDRHAITPEQVYETGLKINARIAHALKVEMVKRGEAKLEAAIGRVHLDLRMSPSDGAWAVGLIWTVYDRSDGLIGSISQQNIVFRLVPEDSTWDEAAVAALIGIKRLVLGGKEGRDA